MNCRIIRADPDVPFPVPLGRKQAAESVPIEYDVQHRASPCDGPAATITSAQWTVVGPDQTLTLVPESPSGSATVVVASAGDSGKIYTLRCVVSGTVDGKPFGPLQQEFSLPVQDTIIQ